MAVRAWHGDKLDKFSDEEIQSVAGTTGDVLRDIGEVTAGYAAGLADAVFLGDAVEGAYSALGVDTQGEMFQGGRTVGMVTSMAAGSGDRRRGGRGRPAGRGRRQGVGEGE